MTMSRLSAAALAIVFVTVFFAAPLYAAVTICAMPCCHHDDAPQCCTISTEKVASTAARTVVPEQTVAVIVPSETAQTVMPASCGRDVRTHLERQIAIPLHLLNSTFRI
jgi:hypothetical protein